jgi:FkbM family methyltransferase
MPWLKTAAEGGADWARDSIRVRRGPLPRAMQPAVIRTLGRLHLRLLGPRPAEAVECQILDYRVKAYSLPTLAFLFREVFVDLDYHFVTDVPNPVILDCGSNIGMSVLFFKSLYPQASIIGFEPARQTFELLRHNVDSNHLPDVTVRQCAVGDSETPIAFFETAVAGSVTASIRAPRGGEKPVMVPQVRLSQIIDREIDFLKLDVEGAEWNVLNDLVASGRLRSIRQMVIEYHHHIEPEDDRLSAFLLELERHGYGYQLRAMPYGVRRPRQFQDLLIYAYRKDGQSQR